MLYDTGQMEKYYTSNRTHMKVFWMKNNENDLKMSGRGGNMYRTMSEENSFLAYFKHTHKPSNHMILFKHSLHETNDWTSPDSPHNMSWMLKTPWQKLTFTYLLNNQSFAKAMPIEKEVI